MPGLVKRGMRGLHPNVPILALCVCLWMSCSSLLVATSALVGFALAEDKSLATLPTACQFLGTMFTSIPAALLMQRIGRKKAFMLSTGFGVLGGGLGAFAILGGHFWLFALAAVCIGVFTGFATYFRFTAADSVETPFKGKAVSFVLLGGVAAAVIGPNLARLSREWVAGAEFAGSYLSLVLLYLLIFCALTFLRLDDQKPLPGTPITSGRPLRDILLQPGYLVALACGTLGYAVMAFVMTATPLAMDQHALHFDDTSLVIQWHVLAMFAPSFFTGSLILRLGVLRVMAAGGMLGLLCVAVNLSGSGLPHFLAGLILLGVSWNFLFVGSTVLITEQYRPEEKNKAQALNDFVVFSSVALATLSAGALHNSLGWRTVNLGVIPLLGAALLSIIWLHYRNRPETVSA